MFRGPRGPYIPRGRPEGARWSKTMKLLRSVVGALCLVLLFGAGAGIGATGIGVHRATHPPRTAGEDPTVAGALVSLESVRFKAPDGVELAGWLVRGKEGGPPVVLCHAFGESKASLLHLAVGLERRGFTVLLLDFRGHGESGGAGSTLGVEEKRDVIGAVDYLVGLPRIDSRKIGIYGVGLGAHAAVLAARDRPALRVLVLDGLYPDASYSLVRAVYGGWSFGVRHLGFLPAAMFNIAHRTRIGSNRAADVLPALRGRDILLLAPAGDSALAAEMERLYHAIPQKRDNEASLVTMPATLAAGLYGEDLDRYQDRITAFFETRLGRM